MAVVLALVALTVAACAGGDGVQGDGVQAGDCFGRGTAVEFDFGAEVGCDQPHTVEVVATAPAAEELAAFSRDELERPSGPARALYVAAVATACEPAWSEHTGYQRLADPVAPQADVLPALYGDLAVEAYPASQWDQGDTTLVCYQVFGRPGFDGERAVAVDTPVLPGMVDDPAAVPAELRDCARQPTGTAPEEHVPCADPHDREYLGSLDMAEFLGARPGLDQALLDAFDSADAESAAWPVLDGICREVFSSLVGAPRDDITLYSQVYTDDAGWGWNSGGAYRTACFAQTDVAVTGTLVGTADPPLPQG